MEQRASAPLASTPRQSTRTGARSSSGACSPPRIFDFQSILDYQCSLVQATQALSERQKTGTLSEHTINSSTPRSRDRSHLQFARNMREVDLRLQLCSFQ